jgi:hypothetical protein
MALQHLLAGGLLQTGVIKPFATNSSISNAHPNLHSIMFPAMKLIALNGRTNSVATTCPSSNFEGMAESR